ncbi:MAG: hypothetical protein IPJ85_16215 [Flavobacteriales bacterium]|nr:hypothetical protein [Flavobacteriales bacterium]
MITVPSLLPKQPPPLLLVQSPLKSMMPLLVIVAPALINTSPFAVSWALPSTVMDAPLLVSNCA